MKKDKSVIGVSFYKALSKYHAQVCINKNYIHLGYFDTMIDAQLKYDEFIVSNKLNRRLNFPDPEPENLIPGTRLIRLSQGGFAIVDEEDYERVNQYQWHLTKGGKTYYAVRNIRIGNKRTRQRIHNFIMGIFDTDIDHRNRNGLHNYKSNLRECTSQQNCFNRGSKINSTSNFKGVNKYGKGNRYISRIMKGGMNTYLGSFDNEIEAAKCYDAKAKELFGEFACLNFSE
jgi:hypothetical protein